MMEGADSIAAKELLRITERRNLRGGDGKLVEFDLLSLQPELGQKPTPAQALSREIDEHKRQVDDQSYLDQAISFVSSPAHNSGSNLEKLEALQSKMHKEGMSPDLEKEIFQAIRKDRRALEIESEFTTYGSTVLETSGLFLGNKKGLALTAIAFAAGSAKQKDSVGTQITDMGLGVARGLTTRRLFGALAKAEIALPERALAMGASSRLADSTFRRKTYLDPETGELDVAGGMGRIARNIANPASVGTDLLFYGGGQIAMLNPAAQRLVSKSPLRATMASSAVLGFSAGSADELRTQWKTGQPLDYWRIAERGLLRGTTDMVAAIPGGMHANKTWSGRTKPALAADHDLASLSGINDTQVKVSSIEVVGAKRNLPGTASREFQIVGGDRAALDLLARSKNASALVDVREVTAGELTGPTRRMLVRHNDSNHTVSAPLAGSIDLIACCNPQALPAALRDKHILPDSSGSVYVSRQTSQLSFGENPAQLRMKTGVRPIELGTTTVSDLLRDPVSVDKIRTPRELGPLAEEMRHFKDRAKRLIDGGADSIVIELADGRILKITDRPYRRDGQPLWRPEWGHRTFPTAVGADLLDARLLTQPFQIEVNHTPVMYYIQERAHTPVSLTALQRFHQRIERDGRFIFWDGDASSLGQTQLGYVSNGRGRMEVALLDYDAVRRPEDMPPDYDKNAGSGSHWMDRYRADRVDWTSR